MQRTRPERPAAQQQERAAMSALRIPVPLTSADGIRLTPWRVEPDFAHLALTATRRQPLSPEVLARTLTGLRQRGMRGVITAALAPADQLVFVDAGFRTVEHLYLLRHSLDPLPPLLPIPTRRARRRDQDAALEVDRAAFLPFWQMDDLALAEALAATRSSRLRVLDSPDGEVVAYAVCGRTASRGYVQRLAVHPDHEGLGYGRALLADGLHWLARWGARDALVNTQEGNQRSHALYVRSGFRMQPVGLGVLRLDFERSGPQALGTV
jgi:ribosomal protein S18 acetylase RimI-like enzyme